VMVIRHSETGAPHQVAEFVSCPVINAGDGTGEHPTQALLDALTIRRRLGRIEGVNAISEDHSTWLWPDWAPLDDFMGRMAQPPTVANVVVRMQTAS